MRLFPIFSVKMAVFLVVCSSPALGATIEIAGIANATTSTTVNSTRQFSSDMYLDAGAGLLIEGKPVEFLSAFDTETGLLYFRRAIGYGTLGTETSSWTEVPIMERLEFWNISIGGGAYLAYGLGKIARSSAGAVSFANKNLKNLDYGWVAGARYSIPSFKLFADARYQTSLRNLSSATATTYKFTDIQLLIGFRF